MTPAAGSLMQRPRSQLNAVSVTILNGLFFIGGYLDIHHLVCLTLTFVYFNLFVILYNCYCFITFKGKGVNLNIDLGNVDMWRVPVFESDVTCCLLPARHEENGCDPDVCLRGQNTKRAIQTGVSHTVCESTLTSGGSAVLHTWSTGTAHINHSLQRNFEQQCTSGLTNLLPHSFFLSSLCVGILGSPFFPPHPPSSSVVSPLCCTVIIPSIPVFSAVSP